MRGEQIAVFERDYPEARRNRFNCDMADINDDVPVEVCLKGVVLGKVKQ